MLNKRTSSIKLAQRESLYFKEISSLFSQVAGDHPELSGIFVNRVELSPDGGLCTVYFYTLGGENVFKEKLEVLKLFKPSIRKSVAQRISKRYTPDLVFRFDDKFEKHEKLEQLLENVSKELKNNPLDSE